MEELLWRHSSSFGIQRDLFSLYSFFYEIKQPKTKNFEDIKMLKINEEKVKNLNNNIHNMVEKYNVPPEQLLMLTLDYLSNPHKTRNLNNLIKKETEQNERNFLLSIRNLIK